MHKQLHLCTFLFYLLGIVFCTNVQGQTNVWINEIHYDNNGSDTGEAVEVVIENAADLQDYKLYLYNGKNGKYYKSKTLDEFTAHETHGAFSFYTWSPTSIQNGPDGVALIYHGMLLQFLSYGGVFMAINGPARGKIARDIGVTENNTVPLGNSLQLSGKGLEYSHFEWKIAASETFGELNNSQFLQQPDNVPPEITEISINPEHPISSEPIIISAVIEDEDEVSSISLHWGMSLNEIDQEITMNLETGNRYKTTIPIPVQPDGQTIYFTVSATDAHMNSKTATSEIQQYTVDDPIQTDFIAIQNFDNYVPAWEYSSDVEFFDNGFGEDGYFGILSAEKAAPLDYSNFSGKLLVENDLNDEGNGTSGFAKTTFEPIDISAKQNIKLHFDYQIIGYNSKTDVAKFQLLFDGEKQPEVLLHQGKTENQDSKGTITLQIPDNVNLLSLITAIRNNGVTGYSGFDNFILEQADHNLAPTIQAIVQSPAKDHVTKSQSVIVSAQVVDGDGIDEVNLHWGNTADNLSHTISMTHEDADGYVTFNGIPEQNNGISVYYNITALDKNGSEAETNTSATKTYTVTEPDPPGELMISEIMQNPVSVANSKGEYFEVYNRTSQDINMNGWKISNAHKSETIDSSVIVPSHGFAVLGINADTESNNQVHLDYQYNSFFFLGNTKDELVLIDDLNQEVNRVSYDGGEALSVWPNPSGASMYFTGTSDQDNNDGSLWKIATTALGINEDKGSPGFSGEASLPETYRYADGWLPTSPAGVVTSKDILVIDSGTVELSESSQIFNLSIHPGSILKVSDMLHFENYINNQGRLIFKSSSEGTGQLGQVPSTAHITGSVTVQRFFPAKRAFRFVAAGVTSTTSIHENWQEKAVDASDNPKSGFGTHITGNAYGNFGFDESPSGSPSLFVFKNEKTDQSEAWRPVSNTDETLIEAGKPFRLFIRGDRSIDVTKNDSSPTKTVLQTSGQLAIGDQVQQNFNTHAGNFNFFGNPYQAIVDMNKVLAHATNLNPMQYYVWDPNMNTRVVMWP